MKRTRFLISSLAVAGLGSTHPLQAALTTTTSAGGNGGDDPNAGKLFRIFKQDHLYTLAGHSSHSSHASHSSHRSSYGGSYPSYSPPTYTPQPVYTPPINVPAPSRPTDSGQSATTGANQAPQPLNGRTELFTSIVRRVQLGLLAFGYYDGPIDGVVGPKMKTSIRNFQSTFHMKETGTITPELLDALKISAQ